MASDTQAMHAMHAISDGIIWLPTCGSTNDEAWARIDDPAVTAVAATHQTAGRGRRGRTWHSPPDCGLYLSVIARPRFDATLGAALPLLAAVTVADLVAHHFPAARPVLKWPNDVLIADHKLCGVLCEARVADDWRAVIGVGLNRRTPPGGWPDDIPGVALDALDPRRDPPPAAALAAALVAAIHRWLDRVATAGLAPVLEAWHRHAPPTGTRMRRGALEGAFAGLDPGGALRLRLDDGSISTVHAGEVELVTHR